MYILSIEWNSIRLGGIVTEIVHKTQPRSLFCLSKTGPCAIISSQISSRFTGAVVFYLLCIPPLVLLVSILSIVQDFRSS